MQHQSLELPLLIKIFSTILLLLLLLSVQELSRYTLADLLAELAQAENEVLDSDEVSHGVESEGARLEMERAAGPMLAPRERKAGCKNFFWKTFTSC